MLLCKYVYINYIYLYATVVPSVHFVASFFWFCFFFKYFYLFIYISVQEPIKPSDLKGKYMQIKEDIELLFADFKILGKRTFN